MKRYLIYATTALLMMGCMEERQLTDPTQLAYDPSKVICITTTTGTMQNAEMMTRGKPISDVADMTDFGAFCYKGTGAWGTGQAPNKMYNRKLTRNASGVWEYATGTPEPWDDTTGDNLYSFFAYAPFGTGENPTTGNGITVTSTDLTVGVPTLKYTVPANVANQPDLMVAEPRYDLGRQYNAVAMKMNHALTCIGFNIAGSGERVVDIAIKGVAMTGNLAMNGTAPITWTNLGPVNTTTSFAASLNYDDDAGGGKKTYYTTTPTMSTNLIAETGYLMMIPQTLTADAKVIITYEGGQSIDFSLNTHTWLPGKKIIYEITIVADGVIVVTPEHLVLPYTGVNHVTDNIKVECFDTDGNPAPTMPWTLTSANSWFTLTLNSNGSNPQTTVSGMGTAIVYTVATPNPSDTDNRTTNVTLNGTTTVVVKVTQLHEVTITDGGTVLDNFYVGAFWRAGEIGERILRQNGTNTGEWVVTVAWMDSNWEVGDIILATGESADDDIDFTDPAATPGSAESFQVEGDQTAIGNVGNILFRVGLKTKWSDHTNYNAVTAPARYAVLILSYGTNYDKHQKIFLRQGHEADYVMRNGDPATSIATGWDGTRNKAMKFSPYNLTAKLYKTNPVFTDGTNVSQHATIDERRTIVASDIPSYFTDYPTQAGAFFQWAAAAKAVERKAYHPTVPATAITTGWNPDYPSTYWTSLSDMNETCPPGWRRPNDGSIASAVSVLNNITHSEMRQSLWLNPQNGATNGNLNNSVWGYYADGYFDRRAITASHAVAASSSTPAYRGQVFYNPVTNASLFFPAAGYRADMTGALVETGNRGYYWSSSADTGVGWNLNAGFAAADVLIRSSATMIRCVLEPIEPSFTVDDYRDNPTNLKD